MRESNKKIEDYFIKKIIKREYPAIKDKRKRGEGYDLKLGRKRIELKVRGVKSLDQKKPYSLELTKRQYENLKKEDFWIFYLIYTEPKKNGKCKVFEYKATNLKEGKDYWKVTKCRIKFSDTKIEKEWNGHYK